jgi:hypothetical protein
VTPDEWLNGPDAVLGDMADWWMSNGARGRWPDGGFAHFTVTEKEFDGVACFHFAATFPHELFGTLTVGCVRPRSEYVPR